MTLPSDCEPCKSCGYYACMCVEHNRIQEWHYPIIIHSYTLAAVGIYAINVSSAPGTIGTQRISMGNEHVTIYLSIKVAGELSGGRAKLGVPYIMTVNSNLEVSKMVRVP